MTEPDERREVEPILVSACLLGESVRYDGTDNRVPSSVLERWRLDDRVVPFCPEVAGGLSTPRPPAEIVGGDGFDVLDGEARVETDQGRDVTDEFERGARGALEAARRAGARVAVLKDGSPSCGSNYVYDGTFSDEKNTGGRGVTAALLARHDVRVY
ncbi:MAG: DUF523 domain-containing protein, partial [Bradymonadaceae bacterium]